MTRALATLALALALTACGNAQPLEDETGWNCATMGNARCS
jgi:hypothetical protein